MGWSAFDGCSSLQSITIPEGVTSIGSSAFYGCSSLQSITIPHSIAYIGDRAFMYCTNLLSISIECKVNHIRGYILFGTAFFNDETNWTDGCLYVGENLIAVNENVEKVQVKNGVNVAYCAFEKCKKLKVISIGDCGGYRQTLYGVSNLETLILTEEPSYTISEYFENYIPPITLKNVVLSKGFEVNMERLFTRISNVNIFVEDSKEDCPWDDDFLGWSNGNKVYYSGEWINAEFKDSNGNTITNTYYTTTQIVRQPYVAPIAYGAQKMVLCGWDLDGDGAADPVPATSTKNIVATAIMKAVPNAFTIKFVGFDGEAETCQQVYGQELVLPENPTRKGYVFDGWLGYTPGMLVSEDVTLTSQWIHVGNGHDFAVSTVVPTCCENGYDKYVCLLCDYEQRNNFVDALGHNFGEWATTIEATCVESGWHNRVCATCGHIDEQEIAPLGHDFETIITSQPDCVHTGEASFVCVRCGHIETQVLESTEHDFQKVVVSKTWLQQLLAYLAHIFFGYEGTDVYFFRCTTCGKVLASDGMSAMNATTQNKCIHELGEWETVLESCCVNGLSVRKCELCGDAVEAKVLEATGIHELVHHEAQAPTCTEVGW
ncbi:MAG: leucine-rich repeat protein, partial [Candidatus Fimimonas sp.]